MLCRLANTGWIAWNRRRERRFARALGDPAAVQQRLLARTLAANAKTAYGRAHGFDAVTDADAFRRRLPLTTAEIIAPWVDRIRRGEPNVLTAEDVQRLVPTSGSTSAIKLIPYTRSLLAQMNAAIRPWIVDLFRKHPDLSGGRAYWSISPASDDVEPADSVVPIGFDDDTAYLGGWMRRLVGRTLAVPSDVRLERDVDAFRFATLRYLLRADDLRLISVWHPSFLALLLDSMPGMWDRLLDAIRTGVGPDEPAQPARAAALARVDPRDLRAIWPRLGAVSAWADAASARPARALRDRLGPIAFQPKGLVATEAFVSLPYAGRHPLAVRSHFFEFLDDAGTSHLAGELRRGVEYEVVVTTAGGLYRYRLGDRVRVDGFLDRTPTLRFLGRADRTSDLCGEKLTEPFVETALSAAFETLGVAPSFAMLAPSDEPGIPGYTLYLEGEVPPPLQAAVERHLSANAHYRYCVRLGQLHPVRVQPVTNGNAACMEHARQHGTRLGNVKPLGLSADSGWRQVLCDLASSSTYSHSIVAGGFDEMS